MPSVQRKVAFYHLTQERSGENHKKYAVSNEAIEENFKYAYGRMTVLENQRHAAKILNGNIKIVVEVVRYNPDEHFAFIKIGHQNHANTTSLRDQNTLEATSVPMQPSQRLELFTYCYLDFTTGIVSYLGLATAPRIGALRAMFDHYLLSEFKTSSSFSAIMSSDIIDMVKSRRVSKLMVSVAVPNDEVLSENINVSRGAFDKLQHVKKVGYTYSISARRFKNMFNSPAEVGEVVAAIKDEHGANLQALKVNAKAEGEDTQIYDLLQHSLTHQVTFDVDDISMLTTDDFFNSLSACYRAKKQDLLRYVRNE